MEARYKDRNVDVWELDHTVEEARIVVDNYMGVIFVRVETRESKGHGY